MDNMADTKELTADEIREQNEIKVDDTLEVVNAKLKTEYYKNMGNSDIAHCLQDMHYPIDFSVFQIKNHQIAKRE